MDIMTQARILTKMAQDAVIRKDIGQILMTFDKEKKTFFLSVGYNDGTFEEFEDEQLFNCWLKFKNS